MAAELPRWGSGAGARLAISELAGLLRTLAPTCGAVRVVAIDGPSGAGKSTLAERLVRALPEAVVVRSDDFPVPWDGEPLAWWPPVAAQILQPLAAGRDAGYRPYHWKTGTYGATVTISAATPILLLEGVGAAWAGSPAAWRIWVDAPFELRRRRALRRDGAEFAPAWEAWTARERALFDTDRTRERADLIMDGGSDLPHGA